VVVVALTVAEVNALPTAGRNRVIDLVRVIALVGVVLGHWLKQGLYVDDGDTLHRAGLLGIAPWTHPLTWLFQVMPLFFLIGGYVNALSWRHARTRGLGYGAWLAGRAGRLTRPLLPLLAFWVVATPLAAHVGLGADWLGIASKTSLVPVWFLATYVVVVALVPLTLAAWERWGAWTLVVGAAALPVDVLSLRLDSALVGGLNLLLVWGVLHQLGYAWRDGTFATLPRCTLLGLLGLGGALMLVAMGPYGVSMVGVDGYGVNNTNPPRATLLLLGVAQAGLVLATEPALRRFAMRPRVWWTVVMVERRVMTVYLWHLTALSILAGASLWFGGVGLDARPNTPEWWALRPAWFLVLGALTVALVALVGRFEDPLPASTLRSPALPLLEVVLTAILLGLLADRGLGPTGHAVPGWLLVLTSFVTLGLLDRLLRTTNPGTGWFGARGRLTG
jgi:Acyltransferase family